MLDIVVRDCVRLDRSMKKMNAGCTRFHFFHGAVKADAISDHDVEHYLGFCDLRPDGTVARGFISELSVGHNDTYSCFVCRLTEQVSLAGGKVAKVTGFPHTEKDGGVVMCAQAAISGVIDFWNHKRPGSFKSSTGP